MKQKCVLIITDGIGYNKNSKFNAFEAAKNQVMKSFLRKSQILY